MTTAIVPRVSGGEEEHGHLEEFRTDPIALMQRVRSLACRTAAAYLEQVGGKENVGAPTLPGDKRHEVRR